MGGGDVGNVDIRILICHDCGNDVINLVIEMMMYNSYLK